MKICKTMCPDWREQSWPTSLPLLHGLAFGVPLLHYTALLDALYLSCYKALVGEQYQALWYFLGFPCPRVYCLWGCQNSFSCSVHNPLPEGSGSLPGQLQRISPAEVQHTGSADKTYFFPFSPLNLQETLELNVLSTSVEIDCKDNDAHGNLGFTNAD